MANNQTYNSRKSVLKVVFKMKLRVIGQYFNQYNTRYFGK